MQIHRSVSGSAPPPATANLPALTISVATLGALPPDYESLTPDLPKARPPSPPALLARLPEIRSHLPPAPAAATEPRRRKAGTRCWSHHARPSRIPASARVGHRPARRVFVAERATSEHPVRRAVAVHDHRRGEPFRIQPTPNHHPIERTEEPP